MSTFRAEFAELSRIARHASDLLGKDIASLASLAWFITAYLTACAALAERIVA